MLRTSLNFRVNVTDFDPDSYRLESTLPLFCDNTPVPLCLFHLRTENCIAAVLPTLRFSREFGLVFLWSCGFFEDLRVACFWACIN